MAHDSDLYSEQPQPVDWDALKAALDWDAPVRREAELTQRLRLRAEQYAAPLPDADASENTARALVFRLGRVRYGLDVALVEGVRPLEKLTRVPGAPALVRGVVSVQGLLISVLDIRALLQDGQNAVLPPELMLIRFEGLRLGLAVDHAEGVQHFDAAALVDPAPGAPHHPIRGVTADGVLVLDLECLLRNGGLLPI